MKIGFIDVDGHNFPNLCLMKISAYHSPAYLGYSCSGSVNCRDCWDIPVDDEDNNE